MFKKVLMTVAVLVALTSTSNARSLSYICEGTISYHPLRAYTAIAGKGGEDACIFVTLSTVGKKILQACPKGSQCSVEGEVNNIGTDNQIYKVVSVHRIGTPALDARAKKDKEAQDRRRHAAILPYAERTMNCVIDHIGKVASQEAVDDALEKSCARQRDALAKEYIKQFGPGGHYLYMEYLSDLRRAKGVLP
jgi:hypothetical protein